MVQAWMLELVDNGYFVSVQEDQGLYFCPSYLRTLMRAYFP
jgi:hypothetical protein